MSEATAQPIVLLPPWPNCCTLVLSVEEKGETWQVEAAVFRLEAGRHRLASPLLRSPKEDETERPNRSQLGFSLSGKIGLGNGWVVEWSKLCFRDLLIFYILPRWNDTMIFVAKTCACDEWLKSSIDCDTEYLWTFLDSSDNRNLVIKYI